MRTTNKFMKWFMKRHPLNSKYMVARVCWIVFTLPIQVVLFTSMAAFKASSTFCEEMRDWVECLSRAMKKAVNGNGDNNMKRYDDEELEMACYGDDEWDAKYEAFERHYPLIKWGVVAALMGLIWLVS